jgi:hypothetical protein
MAHLTSTVRTSLNLLKNWRLMVGQWSLVLSGAGELPIDVVGRVRKVSIAAIGP